MTEQKSAVTIAVTALQKSTMSPKKDIWILFVQDYLGGGQSASFASAQSCWNFTNSSKLGLRPMRT